MLAFHALILLLVPSFVWLGFWQLERWEQRSDTVALQQANLDLDPVPVTDLTSVGGDVAPADRWRSVEVTGTYDTRNELLVRNRDGSQGLGLYVLTPLVTEDGPAALVNRGWVRQPPTADGQPDVPPAPAGEVTVTGRIQYGETEENTGIRVRDGLPERQVMIIDVDRIAADLPYPVYGGFVELVRQDPPSDPAPEPALLHELDLGMSLSYAVQWWVFTAIAIGGWVVLIRRELGDARATAAADPTADADAPADADVPAGGTAR